jgi:hypothetical protein
MIDCASRDTGQSKMMQQALAMTQLPATTLK